MPPASLDCNNTSISTVITERQTGTHTHPPKPRYPPAQFCEQLSADVQILIASYPDAIIILASDFNHLDLGFSKFSIRIMSAGYRCYSWQ